MSISQAYVSKYEKGLAEPNLQLLCRMAESFHVSVDYLFRKSEQKNSYQKDSLSEEDVQLLYRFHALVPYRKEKVQINVGNNKKVSRDGILGQNQPKRRMPKTARTILWEDGGQSPPGSIPKFV